VQILSTDNTCEY